ncbi:phosphopantetheine-binding protein [Haloferula sp.]|uniref:phosphopantetheine-binding protein n=1 Tax=Haloferula sp. TaxID=2497595 RepID=UPI00329D3B6B
MAELRLCGGATAPWATALPASTKQASTWRKAEAKAGTADPEAPGLSATSRQTADHPAGDASDDPSNDAPDHPPDDAAYDIGATQAPERGWTQEALKSDQWSSGSELHQRWVLILSVIGRMLMPMKVACDSEDVLKMLRDEGILELADDCGNEVDLFEAGLDSMAVMQLIVVIEERYGVALGVADVSREALGTPSTMAATINAKR